MFLLQSNETKHKKVTCVGEIWLWVLYNAQNGLCFLSTMGSMDVIIPSQMAECLPSTIGKARTWATVGGRYIVRSAPPPGCQRRCSLPLQVPRLRWLQHQARLSLQAAREQRNTASSSPPSSQTTLCKMRSWGGRFWLDGRELMGMGAEEKPVLDLVRQLGRSWSQLRGGQQLQAHRFCNSDPSWKGNGLKISLAFLNLEKTHPE